MINVFDEILAKPIKNPEMVIKAIFDFLSSKSALDAIKRLDGTTMNQREVITSIKELAKSLDSISEVVQHLSEKVQTDETRVKLAEISQELGHQTVELSQILKGINRDNNGFLKFIVGGIILIIGILASVYFKDILFSLPEDDDSEPNTRR